MSNWFDAYLALLFLAVITALYVLLERALRIYVTFGLLLSAGLVALFMM